MKAIVRRGVKTPPFQKQPLPPLFWVTLSFLKIPEPPHFQGKIFTRPKILYLSLIQLKRLNPDKNVITIP